MKSFAKVNLFFWFTVISAFSVLVERVEGSQSSGTIDATYNSAYVCADGCSASNGNLINFKPTTGAGVTPVTIDDTNGIDGDAWGNQLGWITFGRSGTSTSVVDVNTGAISGYAWAQTSGWINWNPTGYGVTINSNGEFTGYAWAAGDFGGWVKFDCSGGATSTCVKTDWRPVSARTVTPGGGGGGGGGGGSIVPVNSGTTQTTNTGNYTSQTGAQNQRNGDYSNDFRADIDDSGYIDLFDFNLLLVNWGSTKSVDLTKSNAERCLTINVGDLNCDGKVNVLDFNLVLIYWNQYVGTQGDMLRANKK